MACKSITAYINGSCGKVQGGSSELYLVAYNDLTNITGTLKKYSVDLTSNMIDEFGITSPAKFVKVGVLKNTLGFTEDYASNADTNLYEINTTVNLTINNISAESRQFVQDLADAGEVVAILKLRSGRYIALGVDGYLELSAVQGASGVARTDLNGYTITLSGQEESFAKLVDPTIITTII